MGCGDIVYTYFRGVRMRLVRIELESFFVRSNDVVGFPTFFSYIYGYNMLTLFG